MDRKVLRLVQLQVVLLQIYLIFIHALLWSRLSSMLAWWKQCADATSAFSVLESCQHVLGIIVDLHQFFLLDFFGYSCFKWVFGKVSAIVAKLHTYHLLRLLTLLMWHGKLHRIIFITASQSLIKPRYLIDTIDLRNLSRVVQGLCFLNEFILTGGLTNSLL